MQGNKNNTWDEWDFTLAPTKLEYSADGQTKGFLEFDAKREVTVVVDDIKKKKMGSRASKKHCFTITVDHGRKTDMKLAASSEEDMNRWVAAVQTFSVQEALVIKKGSLQKKGHKRKNFLERFFELSRTKLMYYSEEGGKFKGELLFVDGKVEVEYSDQFGNETQGGELKPMSKRKSLVTKRMNWCFTIQSGNKTLIVAAPSEEAMFDWANAIKQAADPRASAVTRKSLNVPADIDRIMEEVAAEEAAAEASTAVSSDTQDVVGAEYVSKNPSAVGNPLHSEDSNAHTKARLSMEMTEPEVHNDMSNGEKTRRLSAFAGPPDGLEAGETAKLYLIHSLCMMALALLPAYVFLLIFSDIAYGNNSDAPIQLGHGAAVHAWLVGHAGFTMTIAGGTFLLFLTLYLLDVSYWEGSWLVVKKFFFTVGGVGIIAVSLLCSNWLPAAPLGVFCILICVYTHMASKLIYPDLSRSDYFIGLSHVLLAIGAAMLSVWCTSTFGEGGQGMWSYEVDQSLRLRVECDPLPTPGSPEKKQDCTAAYLIWIGPLLGAVASWIAAVFSHVIGKALGRKAGFGGARIVVGSVLAIGFGMWCAASVASTNSTISQSIFGLTMLAAIILGMMVSSAIGWGSLKASINHNPLVVKLAEVGSADFVKALIVICCWFPFLCYLVLSALNQCIRVHLGWHPAGSLHRDAHDKQRSKSSDGNNMEDDTEDVEDVEEGPHKGSFGRLESGISSFRHMQFLTQVANNQLRAVHNWRWTGVLAYVMCWGIFFISVNVGITKIVSIFLSWLNTDLLAPLPLLAVIFIFYAIGLFMFLLPPVPGVPVYLAGGIILVKKFEDSGTSFAMSLLFTSLICTCIKLNAVAMQQKCFGEALGDRVWIRSLVGVNSLSIRAIKLILEKPGLSIPKVAILCGGPDWPTSVLTGILRLKLSQMLIGTLPIFFLIMPCVCAGGFQLKKGESEMYASLANVAILSATVAQMTALLAAMYYIEEMADKKADFINALPKDKEVEEVDHKNREKAELKHSVTDWKDDTFPMSMRIVLCVGALAMSMSCYTVQLLGTQCFRAFEVTSTIVCPEGTTIETSEAGCLDGSVLNVILPFGYYVLGLFTVGCVCLYIYGKWASKLVAAKLAGLKDTLQTKAKLSSNASMFIEVSKEGKGAQALSSPHRPPSKMTVSNRLSNI
jgi:hypothetical protein